VRIRTTVCRLVATGLMLGAGLVVVAPGAQAARIEPDTPVMAAAAPPDGDWSKALVESTMKRYTPQTLGGWGYTQGLYLYGQYLVYKRTGDRRYFDYIKAWVDRFVDANGHISNSFNNLDSMRSGTLLVILYKETGDERYHKAADQIRQRLNTYPRTTDDAFWHATSRQWQLWSDGVYMVLPFLAMYGQTFGDSAYTEDEVTKQLLLYASHLQTTDGPQAGLFIHAYDEKRAQTWADPVTGKSPEYWCRAQGWYGMATVDILDIISKDNPRRAQLISILQNLIRAWTRYQDPQTGRWFQVVDKGYLPDNWTETSCSSMYTFVISRAAERGYVNPLYNLVAARGYNGVMKKVTLNADGLTDIADICIGTNVADLNYYLTRPRMTNDLHGLGSFLIMNEQIRADRWAPV
jgi:unsaturated rhamnogalacturonyl hydrolase